MAVRFHGKTASARLSSGLTLLRFAADRGFGRAMAREAFEVAELAAAVRLARPGTTVIDAGAHIGAYALPLASRVGPSGRVYAFEPHPESRDLLRQAVALNGLETRVIVSGRAVTNAGGSRALRSPRAAGGHALAQLDPARLDPAPFEPERLDPARPEAKRSGPARPDTARPGPDVAPPARSERRIQVETTCLDALAIEGRISLIKLDIEGSEGLALRGARQMLRRHRPALVCELDEALLSRVSGTTTDALMAWLAAEGYAAFAIEPDGTTGARLTRPPTGRTSTVLFLAADEATSPP